MMDSADEWAPRRAAPLFGPCDRDRADAAPGLPPAPAADGGLRRVGAGFDGRVARCARPHDPVAPRTPARRGASDTRERRTDPPHRRQHRARDCRPGAMGCRHTRRNRHTWLAQAPLGRCEVEQGNEDSTHGRRVSSLDANAQGSRDGPGFHQAHALLLVKSRYNPTPIIHALEGL